MSRNYFYRMLALVMLAVLPASAQPTAELRRLTLTEAVHLALSQNRALKIARQSRRRAPSGHLPRRP